MQITRKSLCGVGLLAVMGVAVPGATWAQTAKGKQQAGAKVEMEIEEIIVTAQKREENVQEIPISVTALSGNALEEKGATNFANLTESVPNLYVTSTNGASNLVIGLRGLYQGNPVLHQDARTGLYIDGVAVSKMYGANFDLEDLERVEVLRGPQGTLFGRNNIGGAIQMVTRKPTEEPSVTASTEVGNFDSFKGRVTLNVPIVGKNGFFQSDALGTISLRQNAVYKSHDGWYRNQSPTNVPASGGSELSDLSRVFTMTAVRWQPMRDVTIDYAFEYHRFQEHPTATQVIKVFPGTPAGTPGGAFYLEPYVRPNRVSAIGNNALLFDLQGATRPFADEGNNRMHLLTGVWNLGDFGPLGALTAKSVAHYRSYSAAVEQDLDGSPVHVVDSRRFPSLQTWSEEVALLGTAPRLKYALGFYYYGEHSKEWARSVIQNGNLASYQVNFSKNDSYAGYGQATVTPPIFGDRLSLTGGVRYTVDHIDTRRSYRCLHAGPASGNFCNRLPVAGLVDFDATRVKTFHGGDTINFTGSASFQVTDELMAYFQASRGYQSGFVNADATDVRLMNITEPEELLEYELGVKSQWWDNRVRLNVAGFYSDYTNQVINTFRASQTGGVQSILENAGKSSIYGVEVEATAIPFRGVEVSAMYAYLDPKFDEFIEQAFDAQGRPIFDPVTGAPVTTDTADIRPYTYAPAHKVAVGLTYVAPPTEKGTLSAHMDVFWQNDMVLFVQPLTAGQVIRTVDGWAYAVVNGRLQFAEIPLAKGTLDVAVFGKNLFDRKYRTFGIDFGNSLGWQTANFGDPRTFGLGLTYNFAPGQEAPAPAPLAQTAPPPPPPPAKKKIVLRSVHFDFDKATLKADAKPILDEAVQVLKNEGSVDIIVEGHTDSVGTDQYNLGLSRRRAETVRTYLVDHGIARSRITSEGMGESKPVASNDTADGRAQNRRVELHVK